MTTSANSPPTGLLPMELPSMRSAEVSRVRTSQTLASRLALRVSEAVSGQSMPDLLANFDQKSCSWRTSQRCLIEDWTVFSEIWPRSGMMRSGIAYQLAPLAPLTSGTGSGSWPTPRSCSAMAATITPVSVWKDNRFPNLETVVGQRQWPTPHAHCHTGPGHQGRRGGVNLQTAVKMWPTPSARDWKDNPGAWMWNGKNPDGTHRNRTDQLPRKVYAVEGTAQNGGQLNPTWVEKLMGFPTGWTDMSGGR